jgi:hypothetical protein
MHRALVLVVVMAVGCTGGSKHAAPPSSLTTAPSSTSLPVRAIAECKGALKQPDTFVNALPTTVGGIHGVTGGTLPNAHPWSNLYAGKPESAFAAWCWRRVSSTRYGSYVVGPGPPIFLDVGTGFPPTPGPLAVT